MTAVERLQSTLTAFGAEGGGISTGKPVGTGIEERAELHGVSRPAADMRSGSPSEPISAGTAAAGASAVLKTFEHFELSAVDR